MNKAALEARFLELGKSGAVSSALAHCSHAEQALEECETLEEAAQQCLAAFERGMAGEPMELLFLFED